MKIKKISADEAELNAPDKPYAPMQEKVHDPGIYNGFGGLLNRGDVAWEKMSNEWSILRDKDGGTFYLFNYNCFVGGRPLYRIDIYLYPSNEDNIYNKAVVNLQYIPKDTPVTTWSFEGKDVMKGQFKSAMNILAIPQFRTPSEVQKIMVDTTPKSSNIRMTRRPSTEAIVSVSAKRPIVKGEPIEYQVSYLMTDLQGGKPNRQLLANKNANGGALTFDDALPIMSQKVKHFIDAGFVNDASPMSIPEGANEETWNFILGTWKQAPQKAQSIEGVIDEDEDEIEFSGDEMLELGSVNRNYKTAQDFEGYFDGEVPDHAVGMLGSGSVDASQINSMFGKASQAVDLVNRFDSSLLSNVSFIFNFAKSGAYGVYLSELDKAIKTKALQKRLESEGYKIDVDEQGMLRAYPTQEQKNPQEVEKDIERLYSDLGNQGGTAFGINMNAVLSAAKEDAQQADSQSPDIWEWMALLHLGGTIVHEATHAGGSHSEGPSEAAEDQFIQWALPIVNEEYKKSLESQNREEEYTPLMIGTGKRHAKGTKWYKTAQMSYYVPQAFQYSATGSDLSGRHALSSPYESGRADWGLMMQEDQSIPLEKRLGRQYMSPLPEGLDQEHDSYEEQLRKYTVGDEELDPKATMEELLSEGYDEDRAYGTTEELLDEMRVKPIIVPINKNASAKIQKVATTFGWMNNLEISDGSTIPGLSDRVMAWDDRDESFAEEEDWIRQQPRYNPSYDIKGFYYRLVEPRFQPQLWDQMVQNLPGTHPAKRFATKIDSDVIEVFKVLGVIKSKLKKKEIKATRVLLTEDIIPYLENVFGDTEFKVELFDVGTASDGEIIFAAWISLPHIKIAEIEKAEKFLEGNSEEGEEEAETLLGVHKQKAKTIKTIIATLKDICKEYGVKDLYAVGGYPRDLALGSRLSVVEDLDFSCAWPNQAVKIGGLLAEELGVQKVEIFHRTMTLSFYYKGIKLDFKGNFSPMEVRAGLREQGIPTTPLNMDVYNRDFTINMMIYDVSTGKVHDITGLSKKDLDKKVIRPFFDPDYVCKRNPIIILRAIKFKIRYGFEIDPILEIAMKKNAHLLFSGKYTDSRLKIARENVRKEGKKRAKELFKEFGLEKLERI